MDRANRGVDCSCVMLTALPEVDNQALCDACEFKCADSEYTVHVHKFASFSPICHAGVMLGAARTVVVHRCGRAPPFNWYLGITASIKCTGLREVATPCTDVGSAGAHLCHSCSLVL